MADISQFKLPNNTTYNLKDSGAIRKNKAGNTQELRRPSYLNGLNDNTLDGKINTLRANRLAFLPADQIIIEKTTDGGTTWVDAGISDGLKIGLFSETRPSIALPLLNGVRSLMCGLRITITAMKYNVPDGTAETQKYNYWNSNYIKSTERYNQLKEMYFWISAVSDTIGVKVERATGAKPNEWSTIFQNNSWGMTGWSGCDYISFSQGVFGGGTTQTSNWWNYRLTFMTLGVNGTSTMGTSYTSSPQTIMEIRGYGDTWWSKGNEYAANDKIYTHDSDQNVTFPGMVTATQFNGNATTSTATTNARNLLAHSGNEVTLGATSAAAGGSTNDNIWINYRDVMGGSISNGSTKLIDYYFGNRKGSTVDVTVHAATFDGNLTGSAAKVNGHTVNKDVPSDAVFTDTTYSAATTSSDGLMSATDKDKLDRIGVAYDSTTETLTFTLS